MQRVSVIAERIGETQLVAVLDRLGIKSPRMIPRLEALKTLVGDLEREVEQLAALEREAGYAA